MKKVLLLTIIICTFLLSGCFSLMGDGSSTPPQPRAATSENKRNISFLNPQDITGKNLKGIDSHGTFRFLLNEDGTLLHQVNDDVYNGTWSFDETRKMFHYTLDWEENGKPQGYIADFFLEGDQVTLAGGWYLNNMQAHLTMKMKIEDL